MTKFNKEISHWLANFIILNKSKTALKFVECFDEILEQFAEKGVNKEGCRYQPHWFNASLKFAAIFPTCFSLSRYRPLTGQLPRPLPNSHSYDADAASKSFLCELELCSIYFVRPLKTVQMKNRNSSTTSWRPEKIRTSSSATGELSSEILSANYANKGKIVYELLKEKYATLSK